LRSAFRFVAVCSRDTEHREDAAADAPIGAAAEFGNRLQHAAMELCRERVRLFGIELSFELQQAFEARHHDGRIEQLRPKLDGRRSRLGDARDLVCSGVVERRIFAFGAAERGAPSSHQVAIELFGRRLGRDIELSSQHVAAHPILTQRFRIRVALRVQIHDSAMGCFVERLQCDEFGRRRQRAVAVAIRDAQLGELVQRIAQLLAQGQALARQPFVERSRARVEAVEQIAAIVAHRLLQRCACAGVQCATKRMQVAVHDCRIDADRLGVCEQRLVSIDGQRFSQRCERLPQARACELFVRVFPQQRGEPVAAVRFAGTQGQVGKQRAALA
jgi:hypothetical protein